VPGDDDLAVRLDGHPPPAVVGGPERGGHVPAGPERGVELAGGRGAAVFQGFETEGAAGARHEGPPEGAGPAGISRVGRDGVMIPARPGRHNRPARMFVPPSGSTVIPVHSAPFDRVTWPTP